MEEGGRGEGEVEEPKKGDWEREGGRMERWSRGCAIRRCLDVSMLGCRQLSGCYQILGYIPNSRVGSYWGLKFIEVITSFNTEN